ncbi:RNA-binding protein 7 [Topomyia yanbarensis]|uniref:RNA-binding protein 7 n=1 Tax=Topomyia yanbarensis TaxID=2498891 RepID=UPI00273C1A3E|nr:RNA-binding protein 7 [Topomyia yanbarensis]
MLIAMSEEDERTLWCGNLSEKVTEELLYELFVQAGPVEMVKIPKDNDKRQRSYAFITYAHAASVEYAIDIFEGTKLFQRPLTLHKKSKNGANSSASPRMNQRGQQQQHQNQQAGQGEGSGMFAMATMSPGAVNKMMGMMAQMNPQVLAGLGQLQQNQLQNKMNRNDGRSHHQQHQHQKPYSRGDNQSFSRDRNETQMFSRDRGSNHHGGRGGGGGGHQRRNDYRGRRS